MRKRVEASRRSPLTSEFRADFGRWLCLDACLSSETVTAQLRDEVAVPTWGISGSISKW